MVQTKISIVVFILQVAAAAFAPVAALPLPVDHADHGGEPFHRGDPLLSDAAAAIAPDAALHLPADHANNGGQLEQFHHEDSFLSGHQFRTSVRSQIEGIRGLDPGEAW
jgi:hypothetical protein